MRIGIGQRSRLALNLTAGCAALGVLAGCQSQTASQGPVHTGSISSAAIISPSDLNEDEALAAVQKWGTAYSRDGKDKVAALNYAAALRAAGQTGQAVAVARKAAIYHPQDREVLAAYGKALAADGQFRQALSTIQRAQHEDNPDWRLLAAEGGILDSLAKHDEARTRYRQALVLAPGEPQILNNLGLSYLLTNDLAQAEEALREAAASPKATRKVKDNLALVLRLRGKEGEASQISGSPPPRSQAASSEQQNTWDELAKL
jgi:Flp pilus assembly protein TadD